MGYDCEECGYPCLGTDDHHNCITELQDAVRKLTEQRDESDRLLGEKTRGFHASDESNWAHKRWLIRAKSDWGVCDSVSFDEIWAEALQLKRRMEKQ